MLVRVQDIVSKNSLSDKEWKMYMTYIQESHLVPALWAMYRTYIREIDTRKSVVWVYGRAGSGKSFLSD
jgi:DNA replication protein DnaC